MLRHRGSAVIDDVGDFDAAASAVGQIYVVEACGQQADQFYIGGVFQGGFIERRLICEDDIRVFDTFRSVSGNCIWITGYLPELFKTGYVNVRSHAVSF